MIADLQTAVHDQNQLEPATLNGFDGYKFTQSGAAYTVANVTQAGRVAKIKVYQGKGNQLHAGLIGQVLNFKLKSYQAQNGNIYISGFWDEKSGARLPSTPQTPQNAPQSTNYPPSDGFIQYLERIATSLEKIANNGQNFEEKYNLNEEPEGEVPF